MNLRLSVVATAITLSIGLSACADTPHNRSVNSVNQPLVERRNFALDVNTNFDGLPITEQQRLADWFETMDLKYGDRIAIDGNTSVATREDVAALAGRYGLLLTEGAPLTEGFVAPGAVRVVVSRSRAYVPNCPDWSDKQASNLVNATSDNYGCSVNSNLAAMIADPEHLLRGAQSTGDTVVMSSTKAIRTYREMDPTGKGGLPEVSSQSGGGS